jgi:hypothetical protein
MLNGNVVRLLTMWIVVMITAGNVTSHAQELDARVTVNMDAIQMDQRMEARTMAADVERYLNNQRYTGQDWEVSVFRWTSPST